MIGGCVDTRDDLNTTIPSAREAERKDEHLMNTQDTTWTIHKKRFSELTVEELFAIYRLRVAVFVVEQACPYQEVDERDLRSYHLWLADETGTPVAYSRVYWKNEADGHASFGRVIAARRRCGLGTQIVKEAMNCAKHDLGARYITIEAQSYAQPFYENVGFKVISDEFMEDGIPHKKMRVEV